MIPTPNSLIIRTDSILTMDPNIGELHRQDILIEGGIITRIAPGLESAGATVLDATGLVALPGFVDVHRHTWQSAVRHRAVGWNLNEYQNRIQGAIGELLTPEDAAIGNILGAYSALDAGITTIRDESHAQNSPDHTDALIEALRHSGIRARFAYGWPSTDAMQWLWDSDRVTPDDILRVRNDVLSDDDDLVTLNAMLRGPELSTLDVTQADIQRARDIRVAMSMHVGTGEYGTRYHGIRALESRSLIGPDMTFVHCCTSDDDELRAIAAGGAHACVTASVEASMPGLGLPATGRLLTYGVRPSLGIDVEVGTPGDMFSVMRAALMSDRLIASDRNEEGSPLSAYDLLEFATVRGAAALGLADRIGRIAEGMCGDLILVDMNALNLAPGDDVASSLVAAGHPGNVDTVVVGGHVRKRHGRLTATDLDLTVEQARASRRRLLEAAGI